MSIRAWAWRHPEWWALGLSAVAWALLVREAMAHRGGRTAAAAMHHHGDAGMSMTGSEATHWTLWTFALMVVAMMMPAAIGSIRVTTARSLWRRRQRAVAEHLAGFLGVWLAAGAVLLGARSVATEAGWLQLGGTTSAVALGLAALWQLTPLKRRALKACHRTRPLAPSAPSADLDCLAYGAAIGGQCVVSCGPMMAGMTLGPHALGAMVVITAVVVIERYRFRAPRRWSATALALTAAVSAVA